jgi:hypothetical protein
MKKGKSMEMGMEMKKVTKSRGVKKPEKQEMAKRVKKTPAAKKKKDMYP